MRKAILLVGILWLLPSCKNPDIPPETLQPPETPLVPGDGDPAQKGDPSGGGVGGQQLPFTPFIPDGGYTGTIVDITFAPNFSEVGPAIVVLDQANAYLFNIIGREIHRVPVDDAFALTFAPFSNYYVIFDNFMVGHLVHVSRRGGPGQYLVDCNPQAGNFDPYVQVPLGSVDTDLAGQRLAPPEAPASGNPGPVGAEWDIYGNLWVRGTFVPVAPGQCSQVEIPICSQGCPGIVIYYRGRFGPNALANGQGIMIYPVDHIRTIQFSGPPNASLGLADILDFDFDAQNRFIFGKFASHLVNFTDPVPDAALTDLDGFYVRVRAQRAGFGTAGADVMHFKFPWGITVDRSTNLVYVSDPGNHRIAVFDSLGNPVTQIMQVDESLTGATPTGFLTGPLDTIIDPYGRMFIIDKGLDPFTGNVRTDLMVYYLTKPAPPLLGVIRGKVTDAETGTPIFQAQVVLSQLPDPLIAVTDENGEYAFSAVEPGLHTLSVQKQGYLLQSVKLMVNPGETHVVDFALEPKVGAPPRGSVTGKVKDRITGFPIVGARVRVQDVGLEDFTDPLGSFFIAGVPQGFHTLVVTAPGYEPATVDFSVAAGMNTDVGDILLDPVR